MDVISENIKDTIDHEDSQRSFVNVSIARGTKLNADVYNRINNPPNL